jgi:UDP-4-amino-4,6-dideoxy-N-acetyl-beta-L-altrosamine N-acetyltransferase
MRRPGNIARGVEIVEMRSRLGAIMSAIGTLRPIQEDELELMRSWRNAPNVRANMFTKHEISLDEHLAWWGRTRLRSDQLYLMYEFVGRPAGIVGFTSIDPINTNCAWAFYAAPDAPRGTGSRMEVLALDKAFYDLKMHKLYCEVLAFNTAVLRLHRKFGFAVEGILKEHHRTNDIFVDIYRLGLLSAQWDGMRAEITTKVASQIRG